MPRPCFAFLTIITLALVAADARAGISQDRANLYARYASRLEELAKRCEAENLPDAADALRGWLPARAPDQLTLFLPPQTTSAATPDGAPAARVEWQGLRNEQANMLMMLAKQAVEEHQPALAFELVVEALRENPNHERARKLLGYAKFQDGWHTPFEIRQMRAGKVWHDRFGWIPKAYVKRYEKGDRFALGRWMSLEDELTLRSDVKGGRRV
jgi:hypothetical protein